MHFYTGKGDQGKTDLLGARVSKHDPRIATIGALDETTSTIGLGRALAGAERTKELLVEIQRDLYKIMAELAFTDELRPAAYVLGAERVDFLGGQTDTIAAELALPPEFILPGDSPAGAALDVARSVARRAEREAVALADAGQLGNGEVMRYLNRLSSLLFILARYEDRQAGVAPIRAKEHHR